MENILPRRQARENAFLVAFSQTFGDIPLDEAIEANHEFDEERKLDGFGEHLLHCYYDHSAEVDDQITAHLRGWTIARLPRVTVTVLRLAIAEMLFGTEKKPGVVINEAVELTKKYGADEDYQFVNGLLGSVARDVGLDAEANAEQAEQ
jgi:N utilization substance protein B